MSNVVRREGGQMRRAMATPPGPFSMQDLVAAVAKVYLDRCGLNLLFRLFGLKLIIPLTDRSWKRKASR